MRVYPFYFGRASEALTLYLRPLQTDRCWYPETAPREPLEAGAFCIEKKLCFTKKNIQPTCINLVGL